MPTLKKDVQSDIAEAPVEKKPARAKAKAPAASGEYIYAVGRRKTSTAKIRLLDGSGTVTINGKSAKDYFAYAPFERKVTEALVTVGVDKSFDIIAKTVGGGLSSQAQAVAHGVARALVKKDEGYKIPLKGTGLLTRDPRMKERKKPGLKRARKAPQWSKR
jgi:small subunit ribosomal protein S9